MTICLVMIVKNEEKNIVRLFDSILSMIDCYCICDTGSKDNTVNVIDHYFKEKNIDGSIYKHDFKNFEYNRNWILQKSFGKSDFILLLDADMILLRGNNFDKTSLDKNSYYQLYQGTEDFSYLNTRIIPNHENIKYVGVTHEYINIPPVFTKKIVSKDDLFILDIGDGGCKENKFKRDIGLLRKSLNNNQNNTRTVFYLANSLYDDKQFLEAIKFYQKRITLSGWSEEIWFSHYRLGLIYNNLKKPNKAIHHWLECITYNPYRIENIYEIIKLYRIQNKYQIAFSFYKMAMNMVSLDVSVYDQCLFLYNSIYNYQLDYEYTILAFYNHITNIQKPFVNILNFTSTFTNNLLCNYKFYDHYCSAKSIIDLSETLTFDIGTFYSSSACILKNNTKDDEYSLLVRFVNYKINPDGSYLNSGSIISIYKLLTLDSNFQILNSTLLDIPNKKDIKNMYEGNEDIRLFQVNHDILTIGTTFIYNSNTTKITVGIGNFNHEKKLYLKPIHSTSFSLNECEKNWVYCMYQNTPHIIYKWFPLQLCSFYGNQLKIVKEVNTPGFFKIIRGSSCGYLYKNEIWFVTHCVSYETPRHYFHIFVVFDLDMNLLNYTAPLKLSKKPIEYVLSIIVKDETIIVPYSVMDGSTEIGVYDKNYIQSFFYNENKN